MRALKFVVFMPIALCGVCAVCFLEWWVGLENIEGEE